jgi:hypothetical protein
VAGVFHVDVVYPIRVEGEMVDEDKLNQLVGKMLNDLGGAFSVPMVRMGDRL